MSNDKSPEQRAARLLERLMELCADPEKKRDEDRGAMANLRRGFSPATEDRAWPWIARWCEGSFTNPRWRTIYTTVAASFATHHPETAGLITTDRKNMGFIMRGIAINKSNNNIRKENDDSLKSYEARFRRFLNCRSVNNVCKRLPCVIRTAKKQRIPIDYYQLFIDLCYWSRNVKIRWADSYWQEKKGDAK